MQLSALVIARNEEDKIIKTLKSLSFADEIILVLDRSTDKTKDISMKITKKIFEGIWESEEERRNFGIEKCNGKWIFEVDADEIVSEKLSHEVLRNISHTGYDYYYIPLINFVDNKQITNGWMACMAPDGKFCLFRKGFKSWNKGRVHPTYNLKGIKGPKFNNYILHYMAKDISDLLKRFNRNTSLNAKDLNSRNQNLTKLFSLRKVISRFLKCFLIRKGFKDKSIGFLISILSSIYPLVSATKAMIDEDDLI